MLDKLFNPNSVAVIGATDREMSVGRGIVENLNNGKRELYFINTTKEEVFGEKTYKKITDIEGEVDLVVIAVPRDYVLSVVEDCINKQVGVVIIISSGFAEINEEGRLLQEEISSKLKDAEIPFVGPNCLGILRPSLDLNASFAPSTPKEGGVAFISQSGGLIDAVIDDSLNNFYGFSLIVSVGNAAGLNIADYIKFASDDEKTKVIALYIEGVKDGRELFEAIRLSKKPVLFLKAGRVDESLEAISSHTGALAGEYRVFSSILKSGGAVEVNSLEEMFDIAKMISWQNYAGKRIGIVTNGGGAGVLLTDLIYENKLVLAETTEKNPMDVLGDASSEKYNEACRKMISQEEVDHLVVIQTPQAVTNSLLNAQIIVDLKKEFQKPVTTIFMGGGEDVKKATKHLEENRIPNYTDPKRAIRPITIITKKNE